MAPRSGSRKYNLPAPLSSFIGRETEIIEIKQQLSRVRLLTLTGPGGCGKTRLALRVAVDLLADYPDGVWLAEFAPVADPMLVPQVVASSIGIQRRGNQTLTDALIDYSVNRNILFVFDNCEHLISACAQLAQTLLKSCPTVKLLTTSRENLNVPGEAVWSVQPLSLPDPQLWQNPAGRRSTLSIYEKSEAVQLFVARASAIESAFVLTEQNGGWVAEICKRLDGMPLAIELAAALVKMLNVEQIVKRLDDVFQVLTEGSRTLLPRQKTLEAAIGWSYDLLTESEQTLLRRLSVFAGGWSLEAAELVCMDQGADPGDILNKMTHLANKSMVMVDRTLDNEVRYRMLATIHEYAWERLNETGETAIFQRKHAEAFLNLVRQAQKTESNGFWPEIIAVDKLELDLDNFRTALTWCARDSSGYELGLRLASALAQFWQMRGYLREGRKYFEQFLSINKEASVPVLAEAFCFAGYMSIYADDLQRGEAYLKKSLALYQKLGNKNGIAWQLGWLGWLSVAQGDLSNAKAYTKQSFELQRELGDDFGAAVALVCIGEVEYLQGDLVKAEAAFEESLSLVRDIGIFWVVGRRLIRLGQIAYSRADFKKATALTKDGLLTCMENGDKSGVTMALVALAGIASGRGDFKRSARLLGSVEALQEVYGTAMWYVDRMEYTRFVETIRAHADEKYRLSAWHEGRSMDLTQVIDYAVHGLEISNARSDKYIYAGLTPRELEVAALIAQGKSNQQIAKTLVVGVRTVETYVSRILNKLDYDSRVQIATWALKKGVVPPVQAKED
jgi:predicted ATPase/DNA-binding CsgD family transcriptional regulator